MSLVAPSGQQGHTKEAMKACVVTDGSKFLLVALTGVQMLQKWGLLVYMHENALYLLIVFLGKDYAAIYVRICSAEGVWRLEHSPICSLILSSYIHLESSAWWEFSDGHPVLHDTPDFEKFPSPLWGTTMMQMPDGGSTGNTSRERYMLCKLGHRDTCLAPERLNPKPTQVEMAGEGRHRKRRPEGTQGKGAEQESGNRGARGGGIRHRWWRNNTGRKKITARTRNVKTETQWGAFIKSNMARTMRTEITSAAGF